MGSKAGVMVVLVVAAALVAVAVWRGLVDDRAEHVGLVEAMRVPVAAGVSGRVREVSVAAGDRVDAGVILARLGDVSRSEEAEVARRDQARLDAEIALHQRAIDLLRSQSAVEIDTATTEVERATAAARDAETQLAARQAELQTATSALRSMDESDGTDEADADELARRLEQAEQGVRTAAGEVESASRRVETARAELRRAAAILGVAELGPLVIEARGLELEVLRARRRESDSVLRAIESRYEEVVVRSPLTGRVERVSVRPGELADPSTTVVEILDESRRHVVCWIESAQATGISSGTRVEGRTSGTGERIKGQVALVEHGRSDAPAGENGGDRVRVVVTLDNPADAPPAGTRVRLRFVG